MMSKHYPVEQRERAVKMVLDHLGEYRSVSVFKLHFGRLTGKAYTKGERVLRFEAIVHNTAELRCGRMIEKFPEIVTRLAGIAE